MRTNDQEGTVMLSKKRFDSTRIWDNLLEAQENGTVLEGKVQEVIKGGILVISKGIRVFIPASQATASRGDSLEELLGTTVSFRILEVNRARRRAVGSIRSVLREQRKELEVAFWNEIEEGKVYTGKVKSITSYGAFVDLGGVDGMVHISELSWKRIKNPSEVVSVGDIIEVFVKSFDTEKKKVSLGYKKAEDNPWVIFTRDYKVDDVVNVKIVSMTTYGAFANIIDGIDGLIHISQIANTRIAKPQDVLEVGQQVDAQIIQIDEDKKRISLSIRSLLDDQPAVEEAPAEEVAEPAEAAE
jgi:4-hydroxy-3-methylbut-2-enyl diphosphate reductase